MPEQQPKDPLMEEVMFQVRDKNGIIGSRQVPVKSVVDRLIHITLKADKSIELMHTLRNGREFKYKDHLGKKKVTIIIKPLVGRDYGEKIH
jgi:hypothetical protein